MAQYTPLQPATSASRATVTDDLFPKGDECMDDNRYNMLCDPITRSALDYVDSSSQPYLYDCTKRTAYPVRNGIPSFLDASEITGPNRQYQKLYDQIAPLYNLANKVSFLLRHGGEANYRAQLLSELEITDGDSVLEVSCGTGSNLFYLSSRYRNLTLYGLDISWGMLKVCQRILQRNRLQATLIHGQAEALPFQDNAFDVVFHVGGINFFSDKQKAIQEMIRVSKPGRKIVVIDETEIKVRRTYEKIPFVKSYFHHRSSTVSAPVDLVPQDVTDISVKELDKGLMYCISFRKPPI